MFTVWYFLWNIFYFVYTIFFTLLLKFFFNNTFSTDNKLVRLFYLINFNISPFKLFTNVKNLSTNVSDVSYNRVYNYPFLSEIINIFDINTSSHAHNYTNFKKMYNEYLFYSANFKNLNNFVVEDNLVNFIILSKLIFKNFFLNFKNLNLFFINLNYSYNLNFIFFYSLSKKKSAINLSYYINVDNFFEKLKVLNFSNLDSIKFKKININRDSSAVLLNTSRNNYVFNFYGKVYNTGNLFFAKYNDLRLNLVESFSSKINNFWVVKFSASDITKYINLNTLSKYSIFYLRKGKVFNKGRYSRNRQYYRTGVYWSIYVNIIAVVAIYFWFYRFTMNFGYMWWMLYIFMISFFVPKIIKYRFYNIITLVKSFISDILWFGHQFIIIKSYFLNVFLYFLNLIKKLI